jgi:hypothetical protein
MFKTLWHFQNLLKSFAFEKLSLNSLKSQRWRALMITASRNSHHWRLLKSPACGKVHRWLLFNVTRQRWSTAGSCLMWPASGDSIYIYAWHGLENFRSLARIRNDAVRLPNFTAERRRRPRPPSPLRAPRRPPGVPDQRPRVPHHHLRGPRPFSRGPPPRRRPQSPRRSTTSSPSATAPLPYKGGVLLPAGRFPNGWPGTAATDSTAAASADNAAPARHRHLISLPLGTHGGRGWGRRRNNDSPSLVGVFSFFSKCNYMCWKCR